MLDPSTQDLIDHEACLLLLEVSQAVLAAIDKHGAEEVKRRLEAFQSESDESDQDADAEFAGLRFYATDAPPSVDFSRVLPFNLNAVKRAHQALIENRKLRSDQLQEKAQLSRQEWRAITKGKEQSLLRRVAALVDTPEGTIWVPHKDIRW